MGRFNLKELLAFGRGLIATAAATAPAFQSAPKPQRDTIKIDRNKNTVINDKVINNTVINNATIINSTINNSTINNTSIHKTEITQQCSQKLSQHLQQQVAEDPKTPKYQQPDIGFESSFE